MCRLSLLIRLFSKVLSLFRFLLLLISRPRGFQFSLISFTFRICIGLFVIFPQTFSAQVRLVGLILNRLNIKFFSQIVVAALSLCFLQISWQFVQEIYKQCRTENCSLLNVFISMKDRCRFVFSELCFQNLYISFQLFYKYVYSGFNFSTRIKSVLIVIS